VLFSLNSEMALVACLVAAVAAVQAAEHLA
jgi:hypothetical protein